MGYSVARPRKVNLFLQVKYTLLSSYPRGPNSYIRNGEAIAVTPISPRMGLGGALIFGFRQYSVDLYFLCQPSVYTSFRIYTFDSILSRILILQYSARNLIVFCSHQYNYPRTYSFIFTMNSIGVHLTYLD